MKSAAIIGLGLVGGSIARDLAARGVRVVADDRDPMAVAQAIADGVVAERMGESDVEIVIIAVPVGCASEVLRRLSIQAAPLVIDVGSTKSSIVAAASSLSFADRFVGCHPLAGDHRSGYAASRRGMFDGERVYVCPGAHTADEAMRRAVEFWEGLGASVVVTDAARHDRLMATASHLPQVASSALASALRAAAIMPSDLGRGGREMTRLAASSPEMWTQLCLDNAEEIGLALDAYRQTLARFAEALEDRDGAALVEFFLEGREWSERGGPSTGHP